MTALLKVGSVASNKGKEPSRNVRRGVIPREGVSEGVWGDSDRLWEHHLRSCLRLLGLCSRDQTLDPGTCTLKRPISSQMPGRQ